MSRTWHHSDAKRIWNLYFKNKLSEKDIHFLDRCGVRINYLTVTKNISKYIHGRSIFYDEKTKKLIFYRYKRKRTNRTPKTTIETVLQVPYRYSVFYNKNPGWFNRLTFHRPSRRVTKLIEGRIVKIGICHYCQLPLSHKPMEYYY